MCVFNRIERLVLNVSQLIIFFIDVGIHFHETKRVLSACIAWYKGKYKKEMLLNGNLFSEELFLRLTFPYSFAIDELPASQPVE